MRELLVRGKNTIEGWNVEISPVKIDFTFTLPLYWYCGVPLYWDENRRLEVSAKRIYVNFEIK
jgi:hypothetical protein